MMESELLSIGIFLVKVTFKTGQEKYFLSILFWKLIPGPIKLRFKGRKSNGMLLWKIIIVEYIINSELLSRTRQS